MIEETKDVNYKKIDDSVEKILRIIKDESNIINKVEKKESTIKEAPKIKEIHKKEDSIDKILEIIKEESTTDKKTKEKKISVEKKSDKENLSVEKEPLIDKEEENEEDPVDKILKIIKEEPTTDKKTGEKIIDEKKSVKKDLPVEKEPLIDKEEKNEEDPVDKILRIIKDKSFDKNPKAVAENKHYKSNSALNDIEDKIIKNNEEKVIMTEIEEIDLSNEKKQDKTSEKIESDNDEEDSIGKLIEVLKETNSISNRERKNLANLSEKIKNNILNIEREEDISETYSNKAVETSEINNGMSEEKSNINIKNDKSELEELIRILNEKIEEPREEIENPKEEIENPKEEIENPKEEILEEKTNDISENSTEEDKSEEDDSPLNIGIDLGTTNSVISYYDKKEKKVKFVKVGDSKLIPSNIFYRDKNNIYYGKKAKRKYEAGAKGVSVTKFKQYLKADSEKIHLKLPKVYDKNIENYSYYVIDTNVFIRNPEILKEFRPDEKVILPITVEQELEYMVKEDKETKYSAEKAIEEILRYKSKPNSFIEFDSSDLNLLPEDFFVSFPKETGYAKNNDNNDNKILSIAIKNKDKNATLISSDMKLSKLKSDFVGIKSMTSAEFLNMRSNIPEYEEFDISGTEASAMFLKYLKKEAERATGRKLERAVITIPATFNHVEIENTKKAGKKAGFKEIFIEKEPTAAAIAYNTGIEEDKTTFVYDFGGGTFDISIIKSHLVKNDNPDNKELKQEFEICTTAGNSRLGGEDITNIIVEEVYDYLEENVNLVMYSLEESGLTEEHYNHNKGIIYWAAENCKHELSIMEETKINLVELYITDNEIKSMDIDIDREEFESLIKPTINKAVSEMNNALSNAEMYVKDIDNVIMAGGTSLIPCVQNQVEKYFGREVLKDKEASVLIGEGAAIIADRLWSNEEYVETGITIKDKTRQDFGIALEYFNYECIIPAGTQIPAMAETKYSLTRDNQDQINIKVFLREKDASNIVKTYEEGIEYLDEIIMKNIPPMKMDEVDVIVKFKITDKYELNVDAELVKKDGTLLNKENMSIDRQSMY